MKETVKHIYYLQVNNLSASNLETIVKDFKSNYLTELGDSVIVVPSINKEGLENLHKLN